MSIRPTQAAPRERRRSARRVRYLSLAFVAACSTPPVAQVTDAAVVEHAQQRAADLADVARALELADLGPLAVPVPAAPAELKPDASEFWRACAFAWNPEVRQARRRLAAARARIASAGAPGPIELRVDADDVGGEGRETTLALTFDLLGLLGLGASRAAHDLATAEARMALAELENAVWNATFEVDRARVRLSAARSREMTLGFLLEDALADAPRIEILERRGWTPPMQARASESSLHALEHRISAARAEIAAAAAELARVSGLPSDHAAIAGVSAAAVERYRPDAVEWSDPDALALLARLPALRERRLQCGLAEARLRRIAAERWPELRLGPQAMFVPGATLAGAMGEIARAFPGSLDGEIDAALEELRAAVDALEDDLLARQGRFRASRVALLESMEQLEAHAADVNAATARAWLAARASFGVDPLALQEWAMSLERRTEGLAMLLDARETFALAQIDFDQARGVAALAAERAEVEP